MRPAPAGEVEVAAELDRKRPRSWREGGRQDRGLGDRIARLSETIGEAGMRSSVAVEEIDSGARVRLVGAVGKGVQPTAIACPATSARGLARQCSTSLSISASHSSQSISAGEFQRVALRSDPRAVRPAPRSKRAGARACCSMRSAARPMNLRLGRETDRNKDAKAGCT